jgi:hypothetical protein
LVEDSASTDSTPFVIDAAGRVILGTTSAVTLAGSTPGFQIHSTVATQAAVAGWGTVSNQAPLLNLYRSASGTIGTQGPVASGFDLGAINFFGDDGTSFLSTAQILAEVDGAVAFTDMPGRLTFSTRPSGAGGVITERMRIDNAGDVGIGTTNPTARLNVVDNSLQDAVRITQTGGGNALVVEDIASTDSTPFVINTDGRVLVGATIAPPTIETIAPLASLSSAAGSTGAQDFGIYNYQNAGGSGRTRVGSKIFFARSRSGTVGTVGTIVSSGDILGQMRFAGSDGAAFITGAEITAEVDGTPGLNDMPGRLTFSTTADGAASPTERMRITSAGNVGIGTTAPVTDALLTLAGPQGTSQSLFLNAFGADADCALTNTNGDVIFSNGFSATVAGLTERMRITQTGNFGFRTSTQFGSGVGVIGVANATTVPTTNPTGGGVLYVEGGALKYLGSSGTVTTIANA